MLLRLIDVFGNFIGCDYVLIMWKMFIECIVIKMCEIEFEKINGFFIFCFKVRFFYVGRFVLWIKNSEGWFSCVFFIVLYYIRFEVNYWRNYLLEND